MVWCCVKEALSRAAMVRASRGAEAADGGGGAATAPRAPSGSWLELRLPFGADGKLADAFRVFRTDAVCFVTPPTKYSGGRELYRDGTAVPTGICCRVLTYVTAYPGIAICLRLC